MTLLEEAKKIPGNPIRRNVQWNYEHLELIIEFLKGNLTAEQVTKVTKTSRQNIYYMVSGVLRDFYRDGKIKITKV